MSPRLVHQNPDFSRILCFQLENINLASSQARVPFGEVEARDKAY